MGEIYIYIFRLTLYTYFVHVCFYIELIFKKPEKSVPAVITIIDIFVPSQAIKLISTSLKHCPLVHLAILMPSVSHLGGQLRGSVGIHVPANLNRLLHLNVTSVVK